MIDKMGYADSRNSILTYLLLREEKLNNRCTFSKREQKEISIIRIYSDRSISD